MEVNIFRIDLEIFDETTACLEGWEGHSLDGNGPILNFFVSSKVEIFRTYLLFDFIIIILKIIQEPRNLGTH